MFDGKMKKYISLFILLCISVTVHAQDITGRKYFAYSDSVFHVGDVFLVENVFFYFDSTVLRPESSWGLDSLKKFLDVHPNICIEIGVHVDSKGNDYYNLKLSEARALNVFLYLASKGIDTTRLTYRGFGEEIRLPETDPLVHPIIHRTEIKITSVTYPPFKCKYYSFDPSFPGGEKELSAFIDRNLNKHLLDSLNVSGKVVVEFTVDTTGELKNIFILRSLSPEADKELLRLISIMPLWIPGGAVYPIKSPVRFILPLIIPYVNMRE